MKKKVIAALVSASMLALAACGIGNAAPAQTESAAAPTEAAPATEAAPETETAAETEAAPETETAPATETAPETATEDTKTAAPEQGGAAGTYQTSKFTLTLPEAIAPLARVEESDDQIGVTCIAAEKEGGFVASFFATDNPRDYVYLPNDRYGFLVGADGKPYTLVAMLASDVQFGPESQAEYDQILDALPEIWEKVEPKEGYELVKAEDYDTLSIYNDTLSALRTGLEEGKDPVTDLGISAVFHYGGLEAVGYLFYDADGDGFEELYLVPADWTASGDGETAIPVYDMYTQSGGQVHHVFTGSERDFLTVPDLSGIVIEHGSGGAMYSRLVIWNIGYEDHLEYSMCYLYDGETDPDKPYFVSYSEDIDQDKEPMTEEDWNMQVKNYEGAAELPAVQPLAGFTA